MSKLFHIATKGNKATCDSSIKKSNDNIIPAPEFLRKMQSGDENYCKKCYKEFIKLRW